MSNHRLTAWLPENNHIYTDLNKPKPVIYRARFLEHEGSNHVIRDNHWSQRSHRTSRRGHDIISGLRRDMETQVPSRQDSRFSDIVGFDNRERKNIPMTPRDITSQPIISINKHARVDPRLQGDVARLNARSKIGQHSRDFTDSELGRLNHVNNVHLRQNALQHLRYNYRTTRNAPIKVAPSTTGNLRFHPKSLLK